MGEVDGDRDGVSAERVRVAAMSDPREVVLREAP